MSEKKEKTTAEVTKKEKKTDVPEKKKDKKAKKSGSKVKKFFKDFKGEWKKVTWPSGRTVVKNSLVVIAITIVVGAALFAIDTGLSEIIDLLVRLAKDSGEETKEMISLFLLK